MVWMYVLILLLFPAHYPEETVRITYGKNIWYVTPQVRSDDMFGETLDEVQQVCIDGVQISIYINTKDFVNAAILTGKLNEFLANRVYLAGSKCFIDSMQDGRTRIYIVPRQVPGPRNLGEEAWLTPK